MNFCNYASSSHNDFIHPVSAYGLDKHEAGYEPVLVDNSYQYVS